MTLPWTPSRLGNLVGKQVIATGVSNGVGLGAGIGGRFGLRGGPVPSGRSPGACDFDAATRLAAFADRETCTTLEV